MKRLICTALSAALALSLAVPAAAAQIGGVVGHTYYTHLLYGHYSTDQRPLPALLQHRRGDRRGGGGLVAVWIPGGLE